MSGGGSPGRNGAFAVLALLGFAANSLLCRAALGAGEMDAAGFTAVRLVSGAVVLAAIGAAAGGGRIRGGDWPGAAALFAYAAPFSFAYLRLGAAVGTLVAFGVVQVTMIAVGIRSGERLSPRTWTGLALATAGLSALTIPGASAPDPQGVLLMAIAGLAWAVYSLRGRSVANPLAATAGNFLRSVPFALLLAAASYRNLHATPRGFLLAVTSGALASGVGYALWYAALPALGASRAAIVQLTVPVVAGAGAVLLLGEPARARLLVAGGAILGGVALALARRKGS